MSPTTLLLSRDWPGHRAASLAVLSLVYPGWGGGVPGVVRDGWVREGYTGYPPRPSQGPIFNIYLKAGPTHGQMKAILRH